MFSLERKAKEQEREAKLGERELGELRSSNQYLLERLEQVSCLVNSSSEHVCHVEVFQSWESSAAQISTSLSLCACHCLQAWFNNFFMRQHSMKMIHEGMTSSAQQRRKVVPARVLSVAGKVWSSVAKMPLITTCTLLYYVYFAILPRMVPHHFKVVPASEGLERWWKSLVQLCKDSIKCPAYPLSCTIKSTLQRVVLRGEVV